MAGRERSSVRTQLPLMRRPRTPAGMSFEKDCTHQLRGIEVQVTPLRQLVQPPRRPGQRLVEQRALRGRAAFGTAVEQSTLQQAGGQAGMTSTEGSREVTFAFGPTIYCRVCRILQVAEVTVAALRQDMLEERLVGVQKSAYRGCRQPAHPDGVPADRHEHFPNKASPSAGEPDSEHPNASRRRRPAARPDSSNDRAFGDDCGRLPGR